MVDRKSGRAARPSSGGEVTGVRIRSGNPPRFRSPLVARRHVDLLRVNSALCSPSI
jgi:hypothetical protein